MKLTLRHSILVAPAVLGLAVTTLLVAQDGIAPDKVKRSPLQRGPVSPRPTEGRTAYQGGPGGGIAHFPFEFRTIDGSSNNLAHPEWGMVAANFVRMMPNDYTDGVGSPGGSNRPSARVISNLVAAQEDGVDMSNPLGLSDFMWQWGQFLDHDIVETPVADPAEALDIDVPAGDVWFDPGNLGNVVIPLDRSAWTMVDGVRQQLNNITAFIDASNVYGSEHDRTDELRTLDGTGRLKTSDGDLLPFNVNAFPNAPTDHDPSFFLAGDVRANEQVGLTAMHVLFVREHNHWAGEVQAMHPDFSGDQIFEHARAIVAAEMQAITYREFLPRLLGPGGLPPYTGYRGDVDPGIANVVAAAAYRVGHTMLSPTILRVDASGAESSAGHLDLADAFFVPGEVIDHGIDDVLRGLASQSAQNVDVHVVDALRNFLFGPPGSGGFDLASLNIQRGRDHGIASYNQIRVHVGRPPATNFAQITPDPETRDALAAAYKHPDDVDAWVGLLAEPHRPGGFVGETLFRVLRDQFTRLRDGDRFWYRGYLPPPMVQMVDGQTLARIIRRNTDVGSELQNDVFVAGSITPCIGDLNGNGHVGPADLISLLAAWGPCDGCSADFDNDGIVSTTDLLVVLAAWGPCLP